MIEEDFMKTVKISEFRKHVKHYIDLSAEEDIHITKYGKTIAVLSKSNDEYYQTLFNLYGCLKDADDGKNYKDVIGEEIMKRCGY